MEKGGLAIANGSAAIADKINQRKQKPAGTDELSRAVKAQFNPQTVEKSSAEVKGLSATGYVDSGNAAAQSGSNTPTLQLVAKVQPAAPGAPPAPKPVKAPEAEAEERTRLYSTLGFVDLHDHNVLRLAQT